MPLGTVKTRTRSAMLKLRSQLVMSDDRRDGMCADHELALGIAAEEERDAALPQ
ncbi:MAG TPA: hypothetical protein VFL71_08970 [Actinomycetes bacterium]|nr:hypothetical protein [Actinomycetes bacterium]